MITDSPVLLNFAYALDLRGSNPKDAMLVNDLFKMTSRINLPTRYDLIFHLPPFLPPVRDGIRASISLVRSGVTRWIVGSA